VVNSRSLYVCMYVCVKKGKGKVRPGANPGVQAVSPLVTLSHSPDGRLPLVSARPAVTCVAFSKWRHTVAHVRF